MCENELYKKRKDVPLIEIIYEICQKRVIPIDMENSSEDKMLILSLCNAAEKTIDRSKKNPIRTSRPNEVGNNIETIIKTAISEEQGFKIGEMNKQGYPDLLIYDKHERPTYVEIKTFNARNIGSSFRTFYLSPSEKFKVKLDARHIVVSFETEKYSGENAWSMKKYKILDVAKLHCSLKYEWNSDNKKLYDEHTSIILREG